jgi:hypothetical protein
MAYSDWAVGYTMLGSYPCRYYNVQTSSEPHPDSIQRVPGGCSLEVEQPEHEVVYRYSCIVTAV